MPSKRDPSKQRRQARNRAEREARAARRDAASMPPPSRPVNEPTPETEPSSATSAPRRGGFGRSRAAAGGRRRITDGPPGTRAAFVAFLFTIGALATVAFNQTPVDQDGNALGPNAIRDRDRYEELVEQDEAGEELTEEEQEELAELAPTWEPYEEQTRNMFMALWPFSFIFVLPIGMTYLALRMARSANPGRGWMRTMIAMAVFSIISIPILYLPSVIALGVATYQNRKAMAMGGPAFAGGAPAAGGATDDSGGVIDVTGTEDPPSDLER